MNEKSSGFWIVWLRVLLKNHFPNRFMEENTQNKIPFSQSLEVTYMFPKYWESWVLGRVCINHWFRRSCNFLAIFFRNFFANFRKFSGVRGAPPPDTLRSRTPTLNPPEIFSCVRHLSPGLQNFGRKSTWSQNRGRI